MHQWDEWAPNFKFERVRDREQGEQERQKGEIKR